MKKIFCKLTVSFLLLTLLTHLPSRDYENDLRKYSTCMQTFSYFDPTTYN